VVIDELDTFTHANLPEDASLDINQWCEQCTKWFSDEGHNSIGHEQNELQCGSPYPHMKKHHDSIDYCPNKCQEKANNKHKEVVDKQLGVLVH